MIGKKLILALFAAAACSSEQHLPTPDASSAEGGETAEATGELTTSVGTDASKNIGAETAEALPGAFGYKCADKNGSQTTTRATATIALWIRTTCSFAQSCA